MWRLDQNTNLYGPNPALADVDLGGLDLHHYPEAHSMTLAAALASAHGLAPEQVVVTRGADGALELLARALGQAGARLAHAQPSFERYGHIARIHAMKPVAIPWRNLRAFDVEALLAAKPHLSFLGHPDNPTGTLIDAASRDRILSEVTGVRIFDEAYIEYAGPRSSVLGRLGDTDRLVVVRTFSKAYALAGVRLAWLATDAATAARLRQAQSPFEVDRLAQVVGLKALRETAWLDGVVEATVHERERLAAALDGLAFRVHASQANFLLVQPPVDAGLLALGLRRNGLLVKTFNDAHLSGFMRITVGPPQATNDLVAALRQLLEVTA